MVTISPGAFDPVSAQDRDFVPFFSPVPSVSKARDHGAETVDRTGEAPNLDRKVDPELAWFKKKVWRGTVRSTHGRATCRAGYRCGAVTPTSADRVQFWAT